MRKTIMSRGWRLGTLSAALILAGCAAAPRGPALTLAEAGISTTGAFGTDVRKTAAQIQYVDVTEAFVSAYLYCSSPSIPCAPPAPAPEILAARRDLAEAVTLRADAIEALGKAYAALKTEADYDAASDLKGATNDAIKGVNNFAAKIAAIGGAAPGAALISEPLGQFAGFAVGLFADQSQKKRLIAASRAIGGATRRLRDALAVEAYVFDTFPLFIEKNRTGARLALLDAGVISNSDVLAPMTSHLGVKQVAGAEAAIGKSPAAAAAVRAVVEAQSRSEVLAMKARYRASLAALDALLEAHADLEAGRDVSLGDIDRFLGELDAALGASSGETGK